jgi:hypothetical protein
MLRSLGYENSASQVAELYRELVHAFVIDEGDREIASRVDVLDVRPVVMDTIMRGPYEKAALAAATLDAALA